MDIPYDQIQQESLPDEAGGSASSGAEREPAASNDLNTEFREAYKAFTTSSWGVKLGGLWGSVKKQGEAYYQGAKEELSTASDQASKTYSELVTHTQPLSAEGDNKTDAEHGQTVAAGEEEGKAEGNADKGQGDEQQQRKTKDKTAGGEATAAEGAVPESLSADIVKEAQSMYSSFRTKAAEQLKQLEKAEDAADDALLRFGANIKTFFRDAVSIVPPSEDDDSSVRRSLLFESKDPDGRRVVHATRFEAQLHVIHSNLANFTQDPPSDEYTKWKAGFDIEKKTDAIAADLDKYVELRRSMEKLVPEKVEYAEFWVRYYFLRHVVETEEQKRREILKGSQGADEEEVGWDDDDEDEDDAKTPNNSKLDLSSSKHGATPKASKSIGGSGGGSGESDLLKPVEPRRSTDHSVDGSDTSYDVVSAATSRGPGSPKQAAAEQKSKAGTGIVAEESDEDDWE